MKILPNTPSLQFLLREAKVLKSSHRGGDLSVCATIGRFDTSLHGLSSHEILDTPFSVLDAQRVVARLYGFSSWSRLKKYVHRSVEGKNPSDLQLRNKVLDRNAELQKLLTEYKSKEGDYKSKFEQYKILALESTQFLRNAFDRHGWPGPDVVGPDCTDALIAVTVNTTLDANFQNGCTQLMEEALAEGGVRSYTYATLRDRYLVLSKQPSVYGTMFGAYYDSDGVFRLMEYAGVVDPKNLEKRRAQVGYESVEFERRRLAKQAIEESWNIGTYEECLKDFERTSSEGGYLSQ